MFDVILAFTALLLIAPLAGGATNDLTTLLQQGLFEEEANRNLSAAISNYESLAGQFDQNRQIAATAVFRLGECYRKLGRTNDAAVQYQRIVKEFADQPTLATLSRQNLAGMGMAVPTAAVSAERSSGGAVLRAQYNLLKAQIDQGRKETNNQIFLQLFSDNQALAEQLRLPLTMVRPGEQMLAEAKASGDRQRIGNAERSLKSTLEQVATARQQILDYEELRLKILQSAIDQNGGGQAEPTVSSTEPAITDAEEAEIRRIHAMIENSPDLINAPGEGGDTPLGHAAAAGWLRVAGYLLDHGADINLKNRNNAPLHKATASGQAAMVELLLRRGADIGTRDGGGNTALHLAAERGYLAVAKILLEHGADTGARNSDSNGRLTPLHLAANKRNVAIMELLIAKGADVNSKGSMGDTPLGLAAQAGSQEAVELLLKSKADPNAIDKRGRTSGRLFSGATPEITADPNAMDKGGRTPLSLAAGNQNWDVVKTLLAAKADPNLGALNSPLLCAVHYGNVGAAEMLLTNGANSNVRGQVSWNVRLNGRAYPSWQGADNYVLVTPLWLAVVELKDLPMVKLLLKYKADPNDAQTEPDKPVAFSALSNPDILEALLEAGAKVETSSPVFGTLLMAAVSWRATNAVEILLNHGANPNARTRWGATSLHLAAMPDKPYKPDRRTFELLLEHHADPNVQANGQTPLEILKEKLAQNPSQESRDALTNLVALLRQHGARENLPKLDRIEVNRPSDQHTEILLLKGATNWNQLTLFEAVAGTFGMIWTENAKPTGSGGRLPAGMTLAPQPLYTGAVPGVTQPWQFPDLAHLCIRRPVADGKWKQIPVDLEAIVRAGDCARDMAMELGDVLVIPEKDHLVNEQWNGLPREVVDFLGRCLKRTVTVRIAGESKAVEFTPNTTGTGLPTMFSVGAAVNGSGLLRASSDATRVKVIRKNGRTPKTWTVDCTGSWPDLIVRDGDVIEVPEK